MEDFPVVDISNFSNPKCGGQGGCESDLEVSWIQHFLELVLIPSIGIMGVVGNLGSILVLAITDDKTTFKHVSCLHTVCFSILKVSNIFAFSCKICFIFWVHKRLTFVQHSIDLKDFLATTHLIYRQIVGWHNQLQKQLWNHQIP